MGKGLTRPLHSDLGNPGALQCGQWASTETEAVKSVWYL